MTLHFLGAGGDFLTSCHSLLQYFLTKSFVITIFFFLQYLLLSVSETILTWLSQKNKNYEKSSVSFLE